MTKITFLVFFAFFLGVSAAQDSFATLLDQEIEKTWGKVLPLSALEPTPAKEVMVMLFSRSRKEKVKSPGEIYVFVSEKKLAFSHGGRIYLSSSLFSMLNSEIYALYVLNHLLFHSQSHSLEKAFKKEEGSFERKAWLQGERVYSQEEEKGADRYAYFVLAFLGYNLDDLIPFLSSEAYLFYPCQLGFKERVNFLRRVRSKEMERFQGREVLRKKNLSLILKPEDLAHRSFSSFKQGILLGGIGGLASLLKKSSVFEGTALGFTGGFLMGLFLGVELVEW